MSSQIEKIIELEKYQGLTQDFANFCQEEWERKRFSEELFDEDVFIEAVQLILDRLAPLETEADNDH